MFMAAYVDGRFLNETDGSRTWMLKRPSDGAIWYSPNEGYPLGAQSNYLRVMSISCDGCSSIAAIETKCGNYVPAATQPTIPSCWCSFKETIIFLLHRFKFTIPVFTKFFNKTKTENLAPKNVENLHFVSCLGSFLDLEIF